jgi:hypothetical protein
MSSSISSVVVVVALVIVVVIVTIVVFVIVSAVVIVTVVAVDNVYSQPVQAMRCRHNTALHALAFIQRQNPSALSRPDQMKQLIPVHSPDTEFF